MKHGASPRKNISKGINKYALAGDMPIDVSPGNLNYFQFAKDIGLPSAQISNNTLDAIGSDAYLHALASDIKPVSGPTTTSPSSGISGSIIGGIGGLIGDSAYNMFSGGHSTGAGSAIKAGGDVVGGVVGAFNPVAGAIVQGAAGTAGGLVNGLTFEPEYNKAAISQANQEAQNLYTTNFNVGNSTDSTALLNTASGINMGKLGKKKDYVTHTSLLGSKGGGKYNDITTNYNNAREFALNSEVNAADALANNQASLANYTALGGPLMLPWDVDGPITYDLSQRALDIEDAGNERANGGGFHIKKENEGSFTEAAHRAGYSNVQEFAAHVLADKNKDKYSGLMRKKANFARNAAKFHHALGGDMMTANTFGIGGNVLGNTRRERRMNGKVAQAAENLGMGIDKYLKDVRDNPDNYSRTERKRAQKAWDYRRERFPDTDTPRYNSGAGFIPNLGSGVIALPITSQPSIVEPIESLGIEPYALGGHLFASGGDVAMHGADFQSGLTEYNAGGTHGTNPNGGILQGYDPQGVPNTTEEGETKISSDESGDAYVFSDRLKVPKEVCKALGLPYSRPMTFAQASKRLAKGVKERPNDPIEMDGFNAMIARLREAQEEVRAREQAREQRRQQEAMEAMEQLGMMARGGVLTPSGRVVNTFDGLGDTPQYPIVAGQQLTPEQYDRFHNSYFDFPRAIESNAFHHVSNPLALFDGPGSDKWLSLYAAYPNSNKAGLPPQFFFSDIYGVSRNPHWPAQDPPLKPFASRPLLDDTLLTANPTAKRGHYKTPVVIPNAKDIYGSTSRATTPAVAPVATTTPGAAAAEVAAEFDAANAAAATQAIANGSDLLLQPQYASVMAGVPASTDGDASGQVALPDGTSPVKLPSMLEDGEKGKVYSKGNPLGYLQAASIPYDFAGIFTGNKQGKETYNTINDYINGIGTLFDGLPRVGAPLVSTNNLLYRPIDWRSGALAQQATDRATQRALANTSGAHASALAPLMLSNYYKNGVNLGNLMMAAQEANIKNRNEYAKNVADIEKYNASNALSASQANAANALAARQAIAAARQHGLDAMVQYGLPGKYKWWDRIGDFAGDLDTLGKLFALNESAKGDPTKGFYSDNFTGRTVYTGVDPEQYDAARAMAAAAAGNDRRNSALGGYLTIPCKKKGRRR